MRAAREHKVSETLPMTDSVHIVRIHLLPCVQDVVRWGNRASPCTKVQEKKKVRQGLFCTTAPHGRTRKQTQHKKAKGQSIFKETATRHGGARQKHIKFVVQKLFVFFWPVFSIVKRKTCCRVCSGRSSHCHILRPLTIFHSQDRP